ncbi:MAG: hypothetical protein HXY34_02465 [Candidatus Thorarchaeota archaeon]|nr:hypothetical protein [Candidatus Thorarchaeota archaeon]
MPFPRIDKTPVSNSVHPKKNGFSASAVTILMLTASLSILQAPIPVYAINDAPSFAPGQYLMYRLFFRHLLFFNGTRIDTPAEVPGVQNGTLRLSSLSLDNGFILMESALSIQDIHQSTKRVQFSTSTMSVMSEDGAVEVGFMRLWLDISEVQPVNSFTISRLNAIGPAATGVLGGMVFLDMGPLGVHEVRSVLSSVTLMGAQQNWTSFYDRDSGLLLREDRGPADPFLLGLHGIERIDVMLTLAQTNCNIGPPLTVPDPTGQSNTFGGVLDMPAVVGSLLVAIGTVSAASLVRIRHNRRRMRKRLLKEERKKRQKGSLRGMH